jgi:serine/threonine protein kinase
LCKDRTTDKLFAIKIFSKDFLKKKKTSKSDETFFEDIKREIAIMKKLLHPNILLLYEVIDDPKVKYCFEFLFFHVLNKALTSLQPR